MGLQLQGRQLTRSASGKDRKPPRKDKSLRGRRSRRVVAALPFRWDFIPATGEWLPQISEIPIVPGVNGVPSVRAGRDASSLPLRDNVERRKGGTVINESDPRIASWFTKQGVAPELYQADEDDAGETFYFSIFESYRVIGQKIRWESEDDIAIDFRRALAQSGVVPALDPTVRRELIERRAREYDQMVNMHGASPANAAIGERVRQFGATLWAMEHDSPISDWPEWSEDERKRYGYDKPAAAPRKRK